MDTKEIEQSIDAVIKSRVKMIKDVQAIIDGLRGQGMTDEEINKTYPELKNLSDYR
jgi:hypothetical protein